MFYVNTKNLQNAQRLICHFDLFSQIVRLKKTTNKRTTFCCNAALGTLYVDQRNFYCCRTNKVTIKVLLCNKPYFFIQLAVIGSSTTHAEWIVVFPMKQLSCKCPKSLSYALLILLSFMTNITYPCRSKAIVNVY
jgi:hypothetical protein